MVIVQDETFRQAVQIVTISELECHASHNAARHAVIALGITQGDPRDWAVNAMIEADAAGVVFIDPETGTPVCVDTEPLEQSDDDTCPDQKGSASDESILRWCDRRFGPNAPRYQAPPRETVSKGRMALIITVARARMATLALGLGMGVVPLPAPANDNHDPRCPTCGKATRRG